MKKTTLQKYARLIARKGVNVQKGQEVMVFASLDQPEFIKMVVEECYRAGAGKVIVEWDYQPITKLNYRYRSLKTLSTIEKWEVERLEHRLKALPAMIYIESDDPDGLKGINQEKRKNNKKKCNYLYLRSFILQIAKATTIIAVSTGLQCYVNSGFLHPPLLFQRIR